jgi:hypothetical protein
MSLTRPWREVAIPHADVLHGRFAQAEYAADLTTVHDGKASDEYQDAAKFFERTFITEGMKLLLHAVVLRLAGKGGDPVIQLQTAFGGGKTHTMLAVYHLAKGQATPSQLAGVAPILDGAGVVSLTPARLAVLDGNHIAAAQPRPTPDGLTLRTLWGHLAYQLGGAEAYAMVADSDASGTSPGKAVLAELLAAHQPCVILLDETVAYMRQFEEGKSLAGGTFDSILSFVQALTEAVKQVPQAILLASLPESEVELGSERGRQALAVLEKVFGRVQALWKPVSSDEAFEIVRRRLFEPIRDEAAREATCRLFHDAYVEQSAHLPTEVVESRYMQRMTASYPLHPEIFDRLYEDWSTLQGFQRTRGVLKLLAKVVHQLWKDNHQDALILPSAIRLDVAEIRNDLVYYLNQGFDPVIDRDLDGPRAEAAYIDRDDTRFGQLQAARKAARCIFLGGAPAAQELARIGAQKPNRGIDARHIVLGCYRPGENVAVYHDVLGRLRDRLHHLNEAAGHYYLDTRPNMRREMEERKRRFEDADHVVPLMKKQLEKIVGKGAVPVHLFSPSADLPDERGVRLVVLPPAAPMAPGPESPAAQAALACVAKRGETPRQHQNALVFLAADGGALGRVKEQLRTVLAWQSIIEDVEKKVLNLDFAQLDQARKELTRAEAVVPATLREAYRVVLVPTKTSDTDREVQLEKVTLSPSASGSLLEVALRALRDEDHVLDQWAPVHLEALLKRYYWKDGVDDKGARAVWEDLCRYVYMPRLLREEVFAAAVRDGAKDGLWATANGKTDEGYQGLKLGADQVYLDQTLLLVKPAVARAQLDAAAAAEAEKVVPPLPIGEPYPTPKPTVVADEKAPGRPQVIDRPPVVVAPPKTIRYVGTKTFKGAVASTQLRPLLDELYDVLQAQTGTQVRLRIELEGECLAGLSEQAIRALRENSAALGVEADFDQV